MFPSWVILWFEQLLVQQDSTLNTLVTLSILTGHAAQLHLVVNNFDTSLMFNSVSLRKQLPVDLVHYYYPLTISRIIQACDALLRYSLTASSMSKSSPWRVSSTVTCHAALSPLRKLHQKTFGACILCNLSRYTLTASSMSNSCPWRVFSVVTCLATLSPVCKLHLKKPLVLASSFLSDLTVTCPAWFSYLSSPQVFSPWKITTSSFW